MTITIRDVTARWAIWHVTAQCNIECLYCYGSFEGSSYKADWRPGQELTTKAALEVPWGLRLAGYDMVHINGGEPLLRPDIHEIVMECHAAGLGTWLLTNGTVRRQLVRDIVATGALEVLAVSLDTEDASTGDSVRGLTHRALDGLNAALEGRVGTSTRIGVYVVLTKRNLDRIEKLFDFLDTLGVDYVNVQPVYLPAGHSQREALGIPASARHRVAEVMEALSSHAFDCTVPNIRKMAVETLALPPAPVDYCFAAAGDYAYISPTGITFGCPAKPKGVEIGRAFHNRTELASILMGRQSRSGACHWQCGDCLGMYEMASRKNVIERRPHIV